MIVVINGSLKHFVLDWLKLFFTFIIVLCMSLTVLCKSAATTS